MYFFNPVSVILLSADLMLCPSTLVNFAFLFNKYFKFWMLVIRLCIALIPNHFEFTIAGGPGGGSRQVAQSPWEP